MFTARETFREEIIQTEEKKFEPVKKTSNFWPENEKRSRGNKTRSPSKNSILAQKFFFPEIFVITKTTKMQYGSDGKTYVKKNSRELIYLSTLKI